MTRDKSRDTEKTVRRLLDTASNILGSISGILCLGLVALVTVDVILRAFRVPMSGVLEISRLTLGWICFSSLVYTYSKRQHVRVTIFIERWSETGRSIADIFSGLCGSLLMFGIFWKSLPFFLDSWAVREVFNTDVELPYWLAKMSVPVGTFVFGMIFFGDLLRAVISIFRRGKGKI